jgi:hypothetical protein
MTLPLPPKSNLSTVDRTVDWSAPLAGDVITNATVTLTAGTVTISAVEWSDSTVRFTIAGGAVGETATFANTVTTLGGQTLDEALSIYVEAAIGPYGASTTTKATVIQMAYEELASAGYEFDHGADEIASTLRKLDALMLTPPYSSLGYNAPATIGGGDQINPSGLPDVALQTVAVALGVRIAPVWGKTMSPESRAAYVRGVNELRTMVQTIPTVSLRRGTPLGSGNKWRSIWAPFASGRDSAIVYVAA